MGKLPTSKVIFSFLSFGLLWGMATACAPRNDEKARVNIVGPGKAEKNAVECRKSFNDKIIQQVDELSAEVCWVPANSSEQKYSLGAIPVKFEALREGNRILLGITAGVKVSGGEVSQEKTSEVVDTIKSSCLPLVTNMFAKGGNHGLHLTLKASHDQTSEKDQEFTMIPAKAQGAYVLAIWPDQPELVVHANQQCQDKCKDYDGVQGSSCQKKCLSEVNFPFCRNFAKLVGHWVGLHEPNEGSRCERKNQKSSEETANKSNAGEAEKAAAKKAATLMTGYKGTKEGSSDVAQKSSELSGEGLSREEQSQIMVPLCSTLRADANKGGNTNVGKTTGKNKGNTLDAPKIVQQPVHQLPGAVTPVSSTQTNNTNAKAADTKKK